MLLPLSALLPVAFVPSSLPPQQPPVVPIHPWNEGDPDPCLDVAPDNTIEWPDVGGPGSEYGRLVMVELDGDQAPEGVAVHAGACVVFWKLAVYDAPEIVTFPTAPPPVGVADIAALPGGGTSEAGAVLVTDARGLYRVTWHDGVFQDPELLAAGAWIDAAPIHVDDYDQDGFLDVVGVSADRREVLTLRGGTAGFEPGVSIPEPLDIRDVAAVDWDHSGPRELVALSGRGLLVHDALSGEFLGGVGHLSSSGCIVRARLSSAPGDEVLAWTRAKTPQVSELAVIDAAGVHGVWDLVFDVCGAPAVPVNPTALLAGDYDGNGTEELVLVHQANQTAIVLGNQGSPQFFVPGNGLAYDVVPLSESPLDPGGVGIPAFAQLDGVDPDGDGPETAGPLDLAFPVTATSRVEVFLNLAYERALVGSGYASSDVVSPMSEFGFRDEDASELRLAFVVPPPYRSFQYVDLVLWEQPGPVQSTPVSAGGINRRHPLLTELDAGGQEVVQPPSQYVHVARAFPPALCWTTPKPCYYTEFRFVKVLAGGGEVRSPIFTGGFTLEHCDGPDYDEFDYLVLQGIPGASFGLREDQGLDGSPPLGLSRETIGLYVPMSSQPPFSGGRPEPGQQEYGPQALAFTPQEE